MAGHFGQASDTVQNLGDLHVFERVATISLSECSKTYKLNFDSQAECKVTLWPTDPHEVSLQPVSLIGLWQYRDDDFKLSVTFTRETFGYSIRLDTFDMKFKDRLQFKVAQKYINAAIQEKNFANYKSLVARPGTSLRTGELFNETYRGALKSYRRTISFSRDFFEHCRRAWTGLRCNLSALRNTRGETLLTNLAPRTVKSGALTLEIRTIPAWRDGTSFSLLNVQMSGNRFYQNIDDLAQDYAGIVAQLEKIEFTVTQVEGDSLQNAIYSQVLKGAVKEVALPLALDPQKCQATYAYLNGQYKGRCEVKAQWPGYIAQPVTVLTEFYTIKNVSSFVTLTLTPDGWRMDFSGDEKTVGKFSAVQNHFHSAEQSVSKQSARVFLKD